MASRKNDALEHTAENIGAALGRLAGRLDAWKRQRAELGAELQRVLQSAQRMLSDIGGSPPTPDRAKTKATVGRKAGRKGGRPKGYAVSDETRAKLKAAWERRRAAAEQDTAKPEDQRPPIRKRTGRKASNRRRGKG